MSHKFGEVFSNGYKFFGFLPVTEHLAKFTPICETPHPRLVPLEGQALASANLYGLPLLRDSFSSYAVGGAATGGHRFFSRHTCSCLFQDVFSCGSHLSYASSVPRATSGSGGP